MCVDLVPEFKDFATTTGFKITRDHYVDLVDQLKNSHDRMVEPDGKIVGVPTLTTGHACSEYRSTGR